MNKLIMYVFSRTKLGQILDGKKTIIGASLIMMSAIIQALETIAPMFPGVPWIAQAGEQMGHILQTIQPYLNDLGLGFISVGLVHKNAKAAQK